jgi:hypothetical protein
MISLPNDGRYPTLELAPQQPTLEALTAQLAALAQAKPVLMIFEDAHWIDPTSLEVLGRTVDRLKTLGVLLIVTHRPEFEPPWIGRPYVTAVTLNRLGEREITAMIDRVTGNKALPEGIRQDIIERTDGVPLFVEEMTKAISHFMGHFGGSAGNPTVVPTARKAQKARPEARAARQIGNRAYSPFLRRGGASPRGGRPTTGAAAGSSAFSANRTRRDSAKDVNDPTRHRLAT